MSDDVEVIEASEEEYEESLRKVAVVGPWSYGVFDIDYPFEVLKREALVRGYNVFATQTEKPEDGQWRSRILFLRKTDRV